MMNIQTNWDGGGEWRERGVTWLVVWMLLWTQPPRWRCAMICSLIGQIIHVEKTKTKTNTPRCIWRCANIFNFWNSLYFSFIGASLPWMELSMLCWYLIPKNNFISISFPLSLAFDIYPIVIVASTQFAWLVKLFERRNRVAFDIIWKWGMSPPWWQVKHGDLILGNFRQILAILGKVWKAGFYEGPSLTSRAYPAAQAGGAL